MKTYNLLDNISFKIFAFFLIVNLLLESKALKTINNNLEYYFIQSICQLLSFSLNYNCSMNFLMNDNFYNEIVEIENNVSLLIDIKGTKLENILLLLGIIPFLKNNSTLFYKINNKEINKLFKKILNKKIKDKIIKLDYHDLLSLNNKKIKKLLYYKWKLIPKQFILNNLRYIINNYYNESNLAIFEKSLNLNYKSYIKNKINEITFEEKKDLLSKYFY